MQVLVFDTSLDKTYITLGFQDYKGVTTTFFSKKIESDAKNYHSAYLVQQIQEITRDNLVELKNLGGLGVNIGPGSFTGIRVCLTVARTIAQQLNLRLVGISSCEILSKVLEDKEDKICAVALDAKRDMYYYYNPYQDSIIDLISKEKLFSNIREYKGIQFITDTSTHNTLASEGFETINYETQDYPLGEILAKITMKQLNSVSKITQCHWSIIKPLYIQVPAILGGDYKIPYVIKSDINPLSKKDVMAIENEIKQDVANKKNELEADKQELETKEIQIPKYEPVVENNREELKEEVPETVQAPVQEEEQIIQIPKYKPIHKGYKRRPRKIGIDIRSMDDLKQFLSEFKSYCISKYRDILGNSSDRD